MSIHATPSHYSADVKIELIVGDQTLPVSQVGPEILILDDPQEMSPCDGEVIVYVDGQPCRRRVRLVEGIQRDSRNVKIVGI